MARVAPEKADFRPALPLGFLPGVNGTHMDNDEMLRQLRAEFERAEIIRPLAENIRLARDWKERLTAIKWYYRQVQMDIDRTPCDEWAFDVYEVDWPMYFTPIESAIWSDIRRLGLVLYPQYPVRTVDDCGQEERTFFCDFGNPARKVAVECDGKTFHNNPSRDQERDRRLRRAGWTVYRFTGSQCREDFNETTLQRSTVARELERIARLHFNPDEPPATVSSYAGGGFE